MSGHSTEEVMELSLDVDSDDRVLPSDPDDYDYDYDYQEVLRIPPRVQGNFTDSSSDSGNSSDGNSDDNLYMQEQHIAQNFPDKPMTLVPSPAEYDEDFYNDWTLLENGEDTGHPDGLPPFTGTMATTVTGTAPMDYFDALLRDTIWGELAMQTNAYAEKCLSRLGQDAAACMDSPYFKQFARLSNWKAVTANDMQTFAAHLIVLGLVNKPELEEYWSRKTFTSTPFFGKFMSRDRFQSILSNFHVADDTQNPPFSRPGHNPLAKLQPMIDMISASFKTAYKPGKNISVDEGCCPWKGRLRFRQYNPRKPAKFHIKLFQVSDPATGYVIRFSVYTGKGWCYREGIIPNNPGLHNTTTKTVMMLCYDTRVLDAGHCVYFDNFFTSVALLEELFSRQTMACGTSRARVQGPQALQSKKPKIVLQPGEACALRRGPILAFKWHQTMPKNVYMMTMLHNAVETFTGRLERGTGNPIYKPAAIVEYTKQMGGVDLSDQLMNYYNFLHRSCKWWRKLWVHLFNMVILNGHVLNRAFGHQNNVSHYEYRYILVGALLEYTEVPQPLQHVGYPNDVRHAHWPERLPKSQQKQPNQN